MILHTFEMILKLLITQDAIEIDADINDKVVIIIDDVLYQEELLELH